MFAQLVNRFYRDSHGVGILARSCFFLKQTNLAADFSLVVGSTVPALSVLCYLTSFLSSTLTIVFKQFRNFEIGILKEAIMV
jgi:hypothetical protein